MDSKKEAMALIEKRRLHAENEAQKNLHNALENEEFAKAYREYMTEVIDSAKTGKTSNKIPTLQDKINKILTKLKIGSISPVYSCKKCSDTGVYNGKACNCLIETQNAIIIKKSGIGQLNDFTNVQFDIYENPAEMKKLFAKMKDWCHSEFNKDTIYLSGFPGTGKTYLLKCMANEFLKQNKEFMLVTAFKLSQDILKYYASADIENKNSILLQYLNCPILFIDDLGTELGKSKDQNDIIQNGLFNIINERKNKHLPTIITSNLDFSDLLANYDERFSSRIADDKTIKINLQGKDLRFNK